MDETQKQQIKLNILLQAREICNQQYLSRSADLDEILRVAERLFKFVTE
jgi:hypothetical protein